MPDDIPCIIEDSRTYLPTKTQQFGGIAIDVGGPAFCFEERFDSSTLRLSQKPTAAGGRVIMNMLVASDFDPAPDKIGTQLWDHHLDARICDQPGFSHCNALSACFAK